MVSERGMGGKVEWGRGKEGAVLQRRATEKMAHSQTGEGVGSAEEECGRCDVWGELMSEKEAGVRVGLSKIILGPWMEHLGF